MSVVGMTVIFHLVRLVIRSAGIVHHHNKGVVKLFTHHFAEEGLRCIVLGLGYSLPVFIAEGISKLCNGFTEGKCKHAVDFG